MICIFALVMKISEYKSGSFVKQYQYLSFQPNPVNHTWTGWNGKLEFILNEANRKLGELNAMATMIPDINFIQMHVAKEATQSSRIEGTKTTIEEALQQEKNIDPEKRDDWQEVQNYIKALDFAIAQLNVLPLSNRLLRHTHSVLMQNVRGSLKSPGEFRKSQNWIGGHSLADAVFIPPHKDELDGLMGDLENFLNNDELAIPHLIRIAIAHYQFETIHPFLDGNGRLGRLLIILYLINANIINRPMLYISDFFERNKAEYYRLLSEVRTRNNMADWLYFFVSGILETAENSLITFKAVATLKSETEAIIKANLGRRYQIATDLLNYLFSKPVVEAAEIAESLKVHISTVYRLLEDFEKHGIISEKTGYKRNRIFVFEKYLEIFEKKSRMSNSKSTIKNEPITDIASTQLNLFGEGKTYYINKRALKFCIKKHDAKVFKLHYDLRLQFTDVLLKSFAVKPEISMNPDLIANADLVDDHEISAFRKEGTILDNTGQGPVLHFDEGYYTIPGVQNMKELKSELEKGLALGQFNIIFDGYKFKGEFVLKRIDDRQEKWTIQKINDEFANKVNTELWDKSILTGKELAYYNDKYNAQVDELKNLNSVEAAKYIRQNNGESFKYNSLVLESRPDKILPYE